MNPAEVLEALRKGDAPRPAFDEATSAHARILEDLAGIQASPVPEPDAAKARERLASGRPVLDPDAGLPVTAEELAVIALRVVSAASAYRPDLAGAWETIGAWLRIAGRHGTDVTLNRARRDWLLEAGAAGADPDLVSFVLTQALRPFLWSQARTSAALAASRDAGWGRGFCPVCGAEPDLAALGRDFGARRLLCSACDTEWPFRRLECPFCGAEDGGYHPGPDARYRLTVCDPCGRYIKTVDLRETSEVLPLAAERILTLGLDAAARTFPGPAPA